MALAATIVSIVLVATFAQGRAEAQAVYYRSIPLGERAMGMGGAYSGIANDPSATYYNPGGIVTGGRFQLMGGLSSLVFSWRTVDDAFESPNAESNFDSSRTTTLPTFIGTVVRFGRQRFGDHQFALAYSTFEVARESFGTGLTQVVDPGSADLRLNSAYRERWYGFSFGARIMKDVSLGLSAFLSQENTDYSEELGLASGGTLMPDGLRVGGDSATSSTGITVRGYHIVLRLGALYRINPRWQIGFMFQPPGIPVSQNGSLFRRATTAVAGTEPTYFLLDEGGLSTNVPVPFELRTGVEFKINSVTTLSVDASITGPIRDLDVFSRPEELADLPGRIAVYFANSTQRRWTPNLAIGAEHMFGRAVVSGGLFTNLSAAPPVPTTSTTYTPDQVNVYGASFSIGLDTKGYRVTLGANGYFGRGDALAFEVDRSGQVDDYVRTKSTVAALLLYVAGAISVASKGAKQVGEKHKAKKKHESSDDTDDTDAPNGESQTDGTPDDEAGSKASVETKAPPAESPAEPQPSSTSVE